MNVAPDILQALREASIDGPRLALTGPRMDPKTYQRVNEVLEAAGGRWSRAAAVHLFPMDAAEAIAPVLASGQVVTLREKRNQAQYFPTPGPVVERLMELAAIEAEMETLEPSAGSGAIATALASAGAAVDCFEQDPGFAAVLTDAGMARSVHVADFLTVPARPVYDRVVMNPPFTKGADMRHVEHALRFLKPDGILVSVMSGAILEDCGRTAAFRSLVETRRGTVEALPKGAFVESGTTVSTVIVAIPAMRDSNAAPTAWPSRSVEPPAAEEAEFADPAALARQIAADLRKATRAFEAVARSLERPRPKTDATTSGADGQLGFDDLDAA
ncbi:DNA methyltransferase family protein [Streptomyces sp. SGAir0957]